MKLLFAETHYQPRYSPYTVGSAQVQTTSSGQIPKTTSGWTERPPVGSSAAVAQGSAVTTAAVAVKEVPSSLGAEKEGLDVERIRDIVFDILDEPLVLARLQAKLGVAAPVDPENVPDEEDLEFEAAFFGDKVEPKPPVAPVKVEPQLPKVETPTAKSWQFSSPATAHGLIEEADAILITDVPRERQVMVKFKNALKEIGYKISNDISAADFITILVTYLPEMFQNDPPGTQVALFRKRMSGAVVVDPAAEVSLTTL